MPLDTNTTVTYDPHWRVTEFVIYTLSGQHSYCCKLVVHNGISSSDRSQLDTDVLPLLARILPYIDSIEMQVEHRSQET